MKMVYTAENRFLVNNAKNIVEGTGIEVMLKNEFAQGSAGDLAPFDTWLELWVVNDADFDVAQAMLDDAFKNAHTTPWFCPKCKEENDASFELCWNCQAESE